tara:strand:+ start:83 stop:376 length:294 start_codon:yes stop_codon:yes gene_type:complete
MKSMNKKVNNEKNEKETKKIHPSSISTKWKKRAHLQHPASRIFFLFFGKWREKDKHPPGTKKRRNRDLLTRTTEVKVCGFTKICASTNTQNYVTQKV